APPAGWRGVLPHRPQLLPLADLRALPRRARGRLRLRHRSLPGRCGRVVAARQEVRPPRRPRRGTGTGRRRPGSPPMTSAPPVPAAADQGPCSAEHLAGSLRTEINRLAYHLRIPATTSGITPPRPPA